MTVTAEQAVPDLISRLARSLTGAMIDALRESGFHDVTPAFAAILPSIDPAGTRQVEIARRAGMTKQAVGQLVKELAARGYLAVGRDPKDVRASFVTFTERGHRLRERGFEIKAELRRSIGRTLGTDRARELTSLLGELLSCFENSLPERARNGASED